MKLKYEAKNAWEFERENNRLDDVMDYSKGYMQFLNVGKTERTSAREIVRMAKENNRRTYRFSKNRFKTTSIISRIKFRIF